LKFRISGQGKTFFGDGIGLWIVQQGYYGEGIVHGFQEKFTGVGIIFDTFKNTESLAAHRDVTVLINDGEKTYEMMIEDVKGCNINVRYHADRADFSVKDSSRAKVVVNDTSLSILMDARNTGEWTECVNIPSLPFAKDWAKKVYLGLTATTGQLADNHDIISLASYSDFAVMEAQEALLADKKLFPLSLDQPLPTRILRLEEAMNRVLVESDHLDHHLEHELASVQDHIENLLGKVGKREDQAELRIDSLETAVKKEVEGSLNSRLSKLERSLQDDTNRKIAKIEEALQRMKISVDSSLSEVKSAPVTPSGDWKLPFYSLVAVLVVAAGCLALFYRHLLSKWKLP